MTVDAVIESLGDEYVGCEIAINSHIPPYTTPQESPAGHLIIEFHRMNKPDTALGIRWGITDAVGLPIRTELNVAAWQKDRNQPWWSGLVAASFDEAWRIVCLTAEQIQPTEIRLSHGV